MSCGIYKIENIITHKVYVGQSIHIEERWIAHIKQLNKGKHCNKYLQRAWSKYGQTSFSFGILCLCSKDKLNDLETYWCNYYKPNVYNLGATGKIGTMSEETKYKLSKAHIGISVPKDEKWRKNLSEARKGIKFSEEHLKHLSESHKGLTHRMSEEGKERLRKFHTGRKHTDEAKKIIGEKCKGRKQSLEERIKRSNSIKIWWENRKLQA